MDAKELADRLEQLTANQKTRPWRVDKEPHTYDDGTKHFNHVRYDTNMGRGADITVEVAQYVTPDLGELLCLLNNNLPTIIDSLRKA